MDGGLAQLEWSREVIARTLPVSPLYYPPEPGLLAARTRSFDGLHGFLADSLPDGWGYLLMRKRLAKLGIDIAALSPLERLALVGDHGRGALVFKPATTPADDVESLDLDALAHDATALLMGEESRWPTLWRVWRAAPAAPGPRCMWGSTARATSRSARQRCRRPHRLAGEISGAIRSPRHRPHRRGVCRMAEAAGLIVSAHRLLPAKSGPGYFATRRFDRPDGGGRLHMVSLAGAIEAPSETVKLRPLPARDADDHAAGGYVAAAFRRMVFNVLACNRDDHTRQHAYLMEPAGEWRLAPAFDLTYAPGPGGEHYLDIEGEGRRPTRAQVISLGKRHGLDAKRVTAIIEDVAAAVTIGQPRRTPLACPEIRRKWCREALTRVCGLRCSLAPCRGN